MSRKPQVRAGLPSLTKVGCRRFGSHYLEDDDGGVSKQSGREGNTLKSYLLLRNGEVMVRGGDRNKGAELGRYPMVLGSTHMVGRGERGAFSRPQRCTIRGSKGGLN